MYFTDHSQSYCIIVDPRIICFLPAAVLVQYIIVPFVFTLFPDSERPQTQCRKRYARTVALLYRSASTLKVEALRY